MRWIAGIGVLLVTWFSAIILNLNIPTRPLSVLGLGLLAYNALLRWGVGRLDAAAFSDTVYEWFVRFQIGVDWVAMALLIHFSGGIESPAILYFLFHITIASLLLPHDRGYLYVALAPILVGGVALLEYNGVLRHVSVFTPARYTDPLYIAGVLFFFVSASYVMVYFSMTISRRLRRRENELAALYQSARATTSTLDLTEVLNRLAEATAQVLGCKGAAIWLLDESGSQLKMAGSHGLSEAYLDETPIDVARAPIAQEVLSGESVFVADVTRDKRLRDRDEVAAEGVRSILSAPFMSKQGAIGILRVYGSGQYRCDEDDVAFLGAIAAQGAVAIENAQAYQMLEDLDRNKSEFVRIVTHELRSPVQVTGSLLNVLSRGYVGELNAEQADLVDRAQRRIKFLQALIDDLLDLAAGKAEVMATAERGLVSLTDVFEEVYARYESPTRDKGIALQVLYPDEPLKVWGDRSELDRMMTNLVSNAVKYTQEGEVRLELERTNGSARVVIADTGIGIPEDALPRLFEEFFRAENTKDLQETGTGLGLSIVKDLVERYGGEIQVDSVEGEGTTFTLMLPLGKNDANALEK